MNASIPTSTSNFSALTGGITAAPATALTDANGAPTTGFNEASGRPQDFATMLAGTDSDASACLAPGAVAEPATTATTTVTVPANAATMQRLGAVLAQMDGAVLPVIPASVQTTAESVTEQETAASPASGQEPASETAVEGETPAATIPTTGKPADVPMGSETAGRGRKKNRKIPGLQNFLQRCSLQQSGEKKSAFGFVPWPLAGHAGAATRSWHADRKELENVAPAVCFATTSLAAAPAPLAVITTEPTIEPGAGEGESDLLALNAPAVTGASVAVTISAGRPEIVPATSQAPAASSSCGKTNLNSPVHAKASSLGRLTLSPAVRAEITATLTTLLTPVLQELAGNPTTGGMPGIKGAGQATPKPDGSSIMVKIGTLPAFRIELPALTARVTPAESAALTALVEPFSAFSPVMTGLPFAPASVLTEVLAAVSPASAVVPANIAEPGALAAPLALNRGSEPEVLTANFSALVESGLSAACTEAREILPAEWPELTAVMPVGVEATSAAATPVTNPSLPSDEVAALSTEVAPAQWTDLQPFTSLMAERSVGNPEPASAVQAAFKITLPGMGTIEAVFAPVNPAAQVAASFKPDNVTMADIAIALPSRGASESENAPGVPAAAPAAVSLKSDVAIALPEKSAADSGRKNQGGDQRGNAPERIFLNIGSQFVKTDSKEAGIDVAKNGSAMSAPFTSRRVAVDSLEFPSTRIAPDFSPAVFGADPLSVAPATPSSAQTSVPAPALAHRAVETILNVVEAQRSGLTQASSVNLHFKFGGDDLAVRVQLRGAEVFTQFITDSPDLRAALATEWQNLASQGAASGLKLLDPDIVPASAQVSTGFGSASQQHSAPQQNAHQQTQQQAAAFQELRSLRRSGPFAPPVAGPAATPPRLPQRNGSRHLAALA